MATTIAIGVKEAIGTQEAIIQKRGKPRHRQRGRLASTGMRSKECLLDLEYTSGRRTQMNTGM